MKVQIAVKDARNFVNAIPKMKDSGITLNEGLRYIDLAMNKSALSYQVDAYNLKIAEAPKRYREYLGKLQELNLEEKDKETYKDPKKFVERFCALKGEYKDAIEADEIFQKELEELDRSVCDVTLIGIPRSAFIIDEKKPEATEVLCCLLPCIEM